MINKCSTLATTGKLQWFFNDGNITNLWPRLSGQSVHFGQLPWPRWVDFFSQKISLDPNFETMAQVAPVVEDSVSGDKLFSYLSKNQVHEVPKKVQFTTAENYHLWKTQPPRDCPGERACDGATKGKYWGRRWRCCWQRFWRRVRGGGWRGLLQLLQQGKLRSHKINFYLPFSASDWFMHTGLLPPHLLRSSVQV